ncbi:SAM-dependent methyltransferase [Streptomyces albidoflavus]|uniref:SAM-dependent methyltransferase n=1 Tax=Streptomyces albidoflavus TaxID=1886 RepID=UPI0006777E05
MSTRPPLWREAVTLARVARMLLTPPSGRVRRLYEVYDYNNLMTDRSAYINLGYWKSGCDTLDEASEALVDLLAERADLRAGDEILDVGFGYGDQDFRWLKTRDFARLTGVNVTPSHVRWATDRARKEGVADKLEFHEGSATDLRYPAASFHKVLALESAFHFVHRTDFFQQAHRVLRPGGTLALIDVMPLALPESAGGGLPEQRKNSFSGAIPPGNWYACDVYAEKLKEAGFVNVRMESIRDHVYEPWQRYMKKKIADPQFKSRVSRLYYKQVSTGLRHADRLQEELAFMDYAVAVAEKPA